MVDQEVGEKVERKKQDVEARVERRGEGTNIVKKRKQEEEVSGNKEKKKKMKKKSLAPEKRSPPRDDIEPGMSKRK